MRRKNLFQYNIISMSLNSNVRYKRLNKPSNHVEFRLGVLNPTKQEYLNLQCHIMQK